MAYQSRKRNYVSRRERLAKHGRNIRIITIFIVLALCVWVYKNRYDLWAWIKTYFY